MVKQPKQPKFVQCAGCGRRLEISKYSGVYPLPDTPDERITSIVVNRGEPTYGLLCTCGHYTATYFKRPRPE